MTTWEAIGALLAVAVFFALLYASIGWLLRKARKPVRYHVDGGNPIRYEDERWWFYDETWSHRYGPFKHKEWAAASLWWYCEAQLEGLERINRGDLFWYRERIDAPWVEAKVESCHTYTCNEGRLTINLTDVGTNWRYTVDINKSTWRYLMPLTSPMLPE